MKKLSLIIYFFLSIGLLYAQLPVQYLDKIDVSGASENSEDTADPVLNNAIQVSGFTDQFLKRVYHFDRDSIQYRLFVPDYTTTEVSFPLILTLHGFGSVGTDNTSQIKEEYATTWAQDAAQELHPTFIFSPQLRQDMANDNYLRNTFLPKLDEIIDALIREFPVDTTRLYIVGWSMGSYIIWDYIYRHNPERFAAAIPVSGAWIPPGIHVTDIPFWTFHGQNDANVEIGATRNLVSYIENLGYKVKRMITLFGLSNYLGLSEAEMKVIEDQEVDHLYTEFTNADHFITPLFKDPFLHEWLFSKQKRAPFYLDRNGVTIRCPNCQPGDTGTVNGITYEAVNRELLDQRLDEGADLSTLCTSPIDNMDSLFYYRDDFNQDISSWDVFRVTEMRAMFLNATSFNQYIGAWNVKNVTEMKDMFNGALSFNQSISGWCVENILTEPENFATNCPLLAEYYPVWGTCPCSQFVDFTATINEGETYQWREMELTVEDIYYDFVSVEDGCDTVYRLELTMSPTSSGNKITPLRISIFPNPTNSFLTIETDNSCLSIEITSLNGQLVYRGNETIIDMTPYPKGIYFVTVKSDEWVRTEKVVRY